MGFLQASPDKLENINVADDQLVNMWIDIV
jgi:hypothetical protein